MSDIAIIERLILAADESAAEKLGREWLAAGRSAREFQEAILSPAVATIRQRFAQQVIYLPELLVFLRSARASRSVVRDAADIREWSPGDKIVVGSLAWHDHGLCRDVIVGLLEVSGWNVVDLGANVSPVRFAEVCDETRASVLIVAELALATGRMSPRSACREIAALAQDLAARGIRQRTKILFVGLASDEVAFGPHGVDAVCDDLAEVPPMVRRLAGGQPEPMPRNSTAVA